MQLTDGFLRFLKNFFTFYLEKDYILNLECPHFDLMTSIFLPPVPPTPTVFYGVILQRILSPVQDFVWLFILFGANKDRVSMVPH